MKRLIMMVLILVAVGGTTEVSAQSWLKKLGKKVENAAKNAVERNAERKTEESVDKVFNGEIGKDKKDKKDKDKQNNNGNNNADAQGYDNGDATAQTQPQKGQSLEMTYAKSDFVPGDEIIFEDLLVGEQLGEFPSKWDLMSGVVEIAKLNGENTINFVEDESRINPLMEDPKNYLPEIFTVEYDFWLPGMGLDVGYTMRFSDQERNDLWIIELSRGGWKSNDSQQFNFIEMTWEYRNPSDENIHG